MYLMAANCKLSLLDLGRMDVDDGFFIRGATAAVQSNPHPSYERRRVAVVAAVIEHPQAGPVFSRRAAPRTPRRNGLNLRGKRSRAMSTTPSTCAVPKLVRWL